jgi:hypothetical protein
VTRARAEAKEIDDQVKELEAAVLAVGGVRLKAQKSKVEGIKEQIETLQVCVCVCVCVYMYVCMFVHVYIYICLCVCTCVRVSMPERLHVFCGFLQQPDAHR